MIQGFLHLSIFWGSRSRQLLKQLPTIPTSFKSICDSPLLCKEARPSDLHLTEDGNSDGCHFQNCIIKTDFRLAHAFSCPLNWSVTDLATMLWWGDPHGKEARVASSQQFLELSPSLRQPMRNWTLPQPCEWVWKQILFHSSWVDCSPSQHPVCSLLRDPKPENPAVPHPDSWLEETVGKESH